MEPETPRPRLDQLQGARLRVPERDDSASFVPEPQVEDVPTIQEAAAYLANQEEKMDGTRWLYDSDDDYEHAQKKLQAEIAREKFKKDLAQKARVEKAKKLKSRVSNKVKAHTPKAGAFARRHFSRFIKNKKAVIAASSAAVVVLLAVVFIPRPDNGDKPAGAPVLGTSDQQKAPSYDTLFPNNDIATSTGKEFAYEPLKKVTSFTDEIGDAQVTISQQPVPERFKKDPSGELKKFAQDFNAKEKLDLVDTTVYIGTSIKGPQTAVFIKKGLLVFIAADKKFDKQFLSDYVIALN